MARGARKKSETGLYHICQRGNDRQIIFEDDSDRERYLSILDEAFQGNGVRLLAWCLMPNHVHLLIDDPNDRIDIAMHRIGSLYAMYFAKRWSRVGHVFEGRYRSKPINSESHLLEAFRYIHNNPPNAGISPAETYKWSSYSEYLRSPVHCDTNMMLEMLGGAEGFKRFIAERATTGYYYEGGMKLSDAQALVVARFVLGNRDPSTLKRVKPAERRPLIGLLKEAGITIRQIELLTGLSRSCLYS